MNIAATTIMGQQEVEAFLYFEAELLDDWRLPEWAELYTEDAVYEVASLTSNDPRNDSPDRSLFLIADRIDRIRGRAVRLMKSGAHAEYPHSKTRHLITNVRVSADGEGTTRVKANFAVYRTKEDTTTVYMGEAVYQLVRQDGAVRIRNKRCTLDLNSLYNQGRLTIIL
jgi:p-cumate 2,3-dioxygenase beta subunit